MSKLAGQDRRFSNQCMQRIEGIKCRKGEPIVMRRIGLLNGGRKALEKLNKGVRKEHSVRKQVR